MSESRKETVDVQEVSKPQNPAVSETATPSATPVAAIKTAVGQRKTQEPTSGERSIDKRLLQRHANAMKARSGHRRNIRRSNTNG